MKILLLVALLISPLAQAKSIAEFVRDDGVRVVLTNEKCGSPKVINFPYRATWTEQGKTHNGCFALVLDRGLVAAYFAYDRSLALIEMDLFKAIAPI